MEQVGVGEDVVEVFGWQLQCQEILLLYFVIVVGFGYFDEVWCVFEFYWLVVEMVEGGQVVFGIVVEIEDLVWWWFVDLVQQCFDVLVYVVVVGVFVEVFGVVLVVGQGGGGDCVEIFGVYVCLQWWGFVQFSVGMGFV